VKGPRTGWRQALTELLAAWRQWLTGRPTATVETALFFHLEENITPRDTGALSIYCCGRLVTHAPVLALTGTSAEPVLQLLRTHSAELRVCGHASVQFKNVSPWLQGCIVAELRALGVGSRAPDPP